MNARHLTTAVLALGILASSGAALRGQSITFSFGDRDRQAMREWYRDHATGPEFRRRWDRSWDDRVRVGLVLGPDLQAWARPVPPDLYGRLAPLPRGFRYMIVGDHVVVVDRRWRIRDVNRFEAPGYRGDRDRWRDRDDRWDGRIQVGEVLPPEFRDRVHPVDPGVRARLPNRPRYMRYVAFRNRVLLIDNAWIVREVFTL